MSKLLIEEPPLQVLPSLAISIGLNEAIIVQQVHYWIVGKQGKIHEGRRWIYNSYPKWQEQFPFWSRATIQRTFASAEQQGVLISRQAGGFDRQKWYTIDYRKLESSIVSNCDDGQSQNDTVSSYQNDTVLTEMKTTTETTIAREHHSRAPDPEIELPKVTNEARGTLEKTFTEITGLHPPPNQKEAGIRWWKPLREMIQEANGQAEFALRAAVKQMKKDGLTFDSPASIQKTFRSCLGQRNLSETKSAAARDPFAGLHEMMERQARENHI